MISDIALQYVVYNRTRQAFGPTYCRHTVAPKQQISDVCFGRVSFYI